MEKLSISCFAGLRDATFSLRPVTVLIGPQATGKSVVAKLLYFFRGVPVSIIEAVDNGIDWGQFRQDTENRFLRFFPPGTWGKNEFELDYSREEQVLGISGKRDGKGTDEPSVRLRLNEALREAFHSLADSLPKGADKGEESADSAGKQRLAWRESAVETLQQRFGTESGFQQIFVTAARAFVSQAKASVFTQLREGGALDPFVVEFGSFLEQTRNVLTHRGFYGNGKSASRATTASRRKDLQTLHEILARILRGKLVRTDAGEAVVAADGRVVPINLASSGQQEVLPLLLLLSRFFLIHHVHGRSIYVEEPEAHLFPFAQREIVDLLVEISNRRQDDMEVVLTTHSPYILTSLNNLLKAGQRYSEADATTKQKLAKIVPVSRALAPDRLAAYALNDGQNKSIVDEETGLIDPEAIDRVSEILAEEFHSLLWEGREDE